MVGRALVGVLLGTSYIPRPLHDTYFTGIITFAASSDICTAYLMGCDERDKYGGYTSICP